MDIVFVVQGEGRGHVSQAIVLKRIIEGNGHRLVKVFLGVPRGRDVPDFLTGTFGCPVSTFTAPHYVFDTGGTLRYFPTTSDVLMQSKKHFSTMRSLHRQVAEVPHDLVVNFYEHLWGLGGLLFDAQHEKTVSISNQYALDQRVFPMPRTRLLPEQAMVKIGNFTSSVGSVRRVALSLRAHPSLRNGTTSVCPPLLDTELLDGLERKDTGHFLVYLLNPQLRTQVLAWSRAHPETKVHCFGAGALPAQGAVTFHAPDRMTFLRILASCSGFASTAGFQSLSEAMYLGKPAMLVPIPRHPEQPLNAYMAERMGAGIAATEFDLSRLARFLPRYRFDVETYRDWVRQASQMVADAVLTA